MGKRHTARSIGAATWAVLALFTVLAAQTVRDAAALLPFGKEPRPGLITGGEPSAEQLDALAEAGVGTVISLRTAEEPVQIGRAEVEQRGMRWVHIPIVGPESLTDENASALARALAEAGEPPVALYCASGNRVGALLALAAARHEELPPEQALQLGLDAGLTRLEPALRERLGLPAKPPEEPPE
jgi:uncharacterized protein (TIGR01244 family)